MAIRWDKLTVKAQEAIQAASSEAAEHGNPEILPLHLLAALATDREGIVAPVLAKVGTSADVVLKDARAEIANLPKVSGGGAQPSLSANLSKAIDHSFKEADHFKDEYVSTEHLLLAIAQQKGEAAQKILAQHSATHDAILKALTGVRGN